MPESLAKNYHWFIMDVVGSSEPTKFTKEQIQKILILTKLIKKSPTFLTRKPKSDLILNTGDGLAVGFHDSPESPLLLAKELHKRLSEYNRKKRQADKILVRIGINSGPVYRIKDALGHETVWGDGIILAKRVMDLGYSMHILATEQIAQEISHLSGKHQRLLHPIGDYSTKHDEQLFVYNVYGRNLGNKELPQNKSKQKISDPYTFSNPYVEIRLKVKNPDKMLIHHTWIWDEVNLSKKPVEFIPCIIDGKTPRKFSDLNILITDAFKKKLKIGTILEDNPYKKDFVFTLNKPIAPNQKSRIRLEYEWDLPERYFEYVLTSGCKLFKFRVSIPKKVDIKCRVFRYDPITKLKELAIIPPKINYRKNETTITWEASNLSSHEGYRFHW